MASGRSIRQRMDALRLSLDEARDDRTAMASPPWAAGSPSTTSARGSAPSTTSSTCQATIAEFVPDDETLELLRDYGVDFAQGFHIGRPQRVDELWTATGTGEAVSASG